MATTFPSGFQLRSVCGDSLCCGGGGRVHRHDLIQITCFYILRPTQTHRRALSVTSAPLQRRYTHSLSTVHRYSSSHAKVQRGLFFKKSLVNVIFLDIKRTDIMQNSLFQCLPTIICVPDPVSKHLRNQKSVEYGTFKGFKLTMLHHMHLCVLFHRQSRLARPHISRFSCIISQGPVIGFKVLTHHTDLLNVSEF